jgi:hypothetical protein
MSEPARKTDIVLEHMRNAQWREAIRVAHNFKLGISSESRANLKRAHEAYDPTKAAFYKSIGKDPVKLTARGIETLYEIYGARL